MPAGGGVVSHTSTPAMPARQPAATLPPPAPPPSFKRGSPAQAAELLLPLTTVFSAWYHQWSWGEQQAETDWACRRAGRRRTGQGGTQPGRPGWQSGVGVLGSQVSQLQQIKLYLCSERGAEVGPRLLLNSSSAPCRSGDQRLRLRPLKQVENDLAALVLKNQGKVTMGLPSIGGALGRQQQQPQQGTLPPCSSQPAPQHPVARFPSALLPRR